jgi:hypothetical protein
VESGSSGSSNGCIFNSFSNLRSCSVQLREGDLPLGVTAWGSVIRAIAWPIVSLTSAVGSHPGQALYRSTILDTSLLCLWQRGQMHINTMCLLVLRSSPKIWSCPWHWSQLNDTVVKSIIYAPQSGFGRHLYVPLFLGIIITE